MFILLLQIASTWSKILSVVAGYLPVNESVERATPSPASQANPDHSRVVRRRLTAAGHHPGWRGRMGEVLTEKPNLSHFQR